MCFFLGTKVASSIRGGGPNLEELDEFEFELNLERMLRVTRAPTTRKPTRPPMPTRAPTPKPTRKPTLPPMPTRAPTPKPTKNKNKRGRRVVEELNSDLN